MTARGLLHPRVPACTEEVCLTCSDELTAVTVVALSEDGTLARCAAEGVPCEVSVELIDSPAPGDVLLTQAGVALQRLSDEGAGT